MDNTITRQEHEEFARRQDDENKRQNRRIDAIEKSVEQITALTVSVERMTTNMKHMLEVMKQQWERLDKLKREPAETSKQVKMAIITSVYQYYIILLKNHTYKILLSCIILVEHTFDYFKIYV